MEEISASSSAHSPTPSLTNENIPEETCSPLAEQIVSTPPTLSSSTSVDIDTGRDHVITDTSLEVADSTTASSETAASEITEDMPGVKTYQWNDLNQAIAASSSHSSHSVHPSLPI